METIIKAKETNRVQKNKKTSTTTEGNNLRHLYGLFKGKISYDESIFNLGKRSVTV